MNQTTLQIPINKQLRDKAKKVAHKQGFSSLQEMVRVFLSQLAEKNLHIGFVSNDVQLSSTNEKRYIAMLKDNGISGELKNVDEVMNDLAS